MAALLLFGAVGDARDGDIIVEFRGPVLKIASRKEQVSGIWINRARRLRWKNAPSFFTIFIRPVR